MAKFYQLAIADSSVQNIYAGLLCRLKRRLKLVQLSDHGDPGSLAKHSKTHMTSLCHA